MKIDLWWGDKVVWWWSCVCVRVCVCVYQEKETHFICYTQNVKLSLLVEIKLQKKCF